MAREPVEPGVARSTGSIGRSRELAQIERGLDEAFAGRGGIVLISGEPGIGKTWLLEAAAVSARSRGAPVLWGRALPAEGAPPFLLWRQVLQWLEPPAPEASDMAPNDLAAVGRIAPEVPWLMGDSTSLPAVSLAPTLERFDVFDAVARLLGSAAAPAGLIILLDDLQWADPPSLRLLEHVGGEIRNTRVLIVVAHREARIGGDEPLRRCLGDLARVRGVAHLALCGFDENEVGDLLTATCARSLSAAAVSTIRQRTNGNPFFVAEFGRLISATPAQDSGAIDLSLEVPHGARDVIALRVSQLSSACQDVLQAGAVVGSSFSADAVAALLDVSVRDILARLDEALAAGLLTTDDLRGGVNHRFRHTLMRDTVYAEIPIDLRVTLHLKMADHLERSRGAERESTLGERAYHLIKALPLGTGHRAAVVAERAAQVALAQLAYEEAARLYDDAATAAESAQSDPASIGRLILGRARAEYLAGELERAARSCKDAAALAREAGAVTLLADTALVLEGVGDPHLSHEITDLCEQSLALLPEESLQARSRVLAQMATAAYYTGDYGRVSQLSRQALDGAEQVADHDTLVLALRAREIACSGPDGLDERMRIAERMISAAGASRRPADELWGRLWRFDALVERGSVDDAAAEVTALAAVAERINQSLARWHVARCRFVIEHVRGNFAAARHAAERGAGFAHSAGMLAHGRHHTQRVLIAWLTGDDCDEDFAALERAGASDAIVQRVLRGLVALSQGRQHEATLMSDSLPPLAHFQPMPAILLLARAYRSVLSSELVRVDECALLYDQQLVHADRYVVGSAGAVACLGSVELYLGMLAGAMGRFDAAARHLERAVERNSTAGLQPWAAESRYRLAETLHRRGRPDDVGRALVLTAESREVAGRLGMKPLATRASALEEVLRSRTRRARLLTPREEQIARLVAQGLTSREIGEAMHITARTADTHVQHVLDKLGLRTRSQIAARLGIRS